MAGFIFDMDGCLLDSIHAWFTVEGRVLESAGIALTKEQRDELNTLTLEEAGEWFHEKFGIASNGAQVAQSMVGYLKDFYSTQVKAKSGAVDFVRALHDAGQPLCVLSSSPQVFLQIGLGHVGLKDFFSDDLIISADDRGWTKRQPETFAHVCKALGTDPADTWMFDDSWYALETAHDSGLRCIGVFSSDRCGTHEEMARFSERVVDDFTALNADDFLR